MWPWLKPIVSRSYIKQCFPLGTHSGSDQSMVESAVTEGQGKKHCQFSFCEWTQQHKHEVPSIKATIFKVITEEKQQLVEEKYIRKVLLWIIHSIMAVLRCRRRLSCIWVEALILNRLSCGQSNPFVICSNADNYYTGKLLEVAAECRRTCARHSSRGVVAFLNSPRHLTLWTASSSQVSCEMSV